MWSERQHRTDHSAMRRLWTQTDLCELPGRYEKYCLECSADVAASILLTTEIDAATLTGKETSGLVAEFVQVSRRILARSQ